MEDKYDESYFSEIESQMKTLREDIDRTKSYISSELSQYNN